MINLHNSLIDAGGGEREEWERAEAKNIARVQRWTEMLKVFDAIRFVLSGGTQNICSWKLI